MLTDIPQATGGALTEIAGINDRGHLTGWGPGGSPIQAFYGMAWWRGALGDPAKSNIAYGLNNLDDVAGAISRAAAVWTNGRTIELASPRGYSIAEARRHQRPRRRRRQRVGVVDAVRLAGGLLACGDGRRDAEPELTRPGCGSA